jgi:ABC-2 type transport system permease protein
MSNVSATVPVQQAVLLQWLRWRQLANTLRLLLRQSRVRLVTIVACSVLIWGTVYVVSHLGFHELRHRWHVPLNGFLIVDVFSLLFLALSTLLVFSTGIILYSSLFLSKESSFLLSTPLSADQIFAVKYQGALGFSSWAFVLLASPLFLAYGLVGPEHGAPAIYYLMVPLYFFGLVLFPGSIGALICLLFINFFPRRRKQALLLLVAALIGSTLWWMVTRLWPATGQLLRGGNGFGDLLGELGQLRGLFPPARWTAEGFRAAANGEMVATWYYLALVWSNGLILYVAVTWLSGRLYRRGHNLLASGIDQRRTYRPMLIDRLFAGVLCFLDRQTRTLIEKDFRTFRRDPAQWAQILIFLGLVLLIFGNMRNAIFQQVSGPFRPAISLLNLTATGFLMCAYAGRFVYPMLSLEGKKFWILGLLPLERKKLLWGKFYFSTICTLLTGELLSNLSNVALGMPWPIFVIHSLTVAVLALGLSGLSTGMGATVPNFRESDPSKIAVGFGGTMMLIAGLLFELVVILLIAAPWHVIPILMMSEAVKTGLDLLWLWPWLGMAGGLIIGALGVWIPMRTGTRALQRMEF